MYVKTIKNIRTGEELNKMAHFTRRNFIQRNALIAAAGAAGSMMPKNAHATRIGNIKLAMHLSLGNPDRLKI